MDSRGITTTVALLLLVTLVKCQENDNGKSVTEIIDEITAPPYDATEPPVTDTNKSISVRIGMYILNFNNIDPYKMEYSMTYYLRQNWPDSRLKPYGDDYEDKDALIVPENRLDKFWMPDTFSRNLIKNNGDEQTLLKINGTGWMWHVRKLGGSFSCPMKLQKFPFDTQMCSFQIESFKHTVANGYGLGWLSYPIDVGRDIDFGEYSLLDSVIHDCTANYSSGTYPCLKVRFMLKRNSGYYVLKFYCPTTLMVLAAWVTLWMSRRDSQHLRCFTCLALLLFSLYMIQQASDARPPVSYVTALDVWTYLCMAFVLCAFAEYFIVYFILMDRSVFNAPGDAVKTPAWTKAVDLVFRIGYIIAFILALIIYGSLHSA